MNIIYLLTNKDRKSGKRFYIGSKQECTLVEIDGISTIIGRTGKPYIGSSTSSEFKEDVRNGHVFEASILEKVSRREDLLERENYWILKNDAVSSDEFYNKSQAVIGACRSDAMLNGVINKFGETLSEYAKNCSSMNNRNNRARKLGYKNFGVMYFDFIERKNKGESLSSIAVNLGMERHYAARMIKGFDENKSNDDVKMTHLIPVLRNHIMHGASTKKACEIEDLEWPAGVVLLGDFDPNMEQNYSASYHKGLTKHELEDTILSLILEDYTIKNAASLLEVNEASVRRYFIRGVKRHIIKENLTDDCSSRYR